MKLIDLMTGVTPDPAYAGIATANDMILAVNLDDASSPVEYLVAQEGVTEASGTLTSQTQESQYLRTGLVTIKTGTSRSFTVTGDRFMNDEFQDALLSYGIKYGTGQTVIKDYVYFCLLTGKGEKGKVSIAIDADLGGAAGSNATFTATLTSTVKPIEYDYNAILLV